MDGQALTVLLRMNPELPRMLLLASIRLIWNFWRAEGQQTKAFEPSLNLSEGRFGCTFWAMGFIG